MTTFDLAFGGIIGIFVGIVIVVSVALALRHRGLL